MPESHNDPGWRFTEEEYYQKSTKHTFTSVTNYMAKHNYTTFHVADLMYFMKWYDEQNEETQNMTKKLIDQDRIVFINGGWIMSDEAVPSYKQSLLQFRLGLDVMNSTFGKRATIGWQSDSFGNSIITATNLHKLGYDFLVANRISVDFKNILRDVDGHQFFWEGHQVSKDKSDSNLFTYVLPFHYTVPTYKLDYGIKAHRRYNYKIDAYFDTKVDSAIRGFNALTNGEIPEFHIINSVSDDFGYTDADLTYNELIRFSKSLIETGNSQDYNTSIVYSTYYEYLKILKRQNFTYGQFKGDFLPYQETYNGETDFWSGYFSTKIYLKRQVSHLFNEIQTTNCS